MNIPIRHEEGYLVIECGSTDMLADVAERFPDLIADQESGTCVLLDMSKVDAIKGDGLETLMQVHELGQDHSIKVGMFQVAFYVQQLLAVLDLHDQLPHIVDGDETEAAKALKAHGTDPNNETDVDFEFELPGDDPADGSEDVGTVKLPREQFLAAPSDGEASVKVEEDDPSSDYLAVNFDDFQPPVQEVEEDDTFEISLDGDMAFADTDKFSLSDVAQAVKDQANEGAGVVYDDSNDSWDDDDQADNAQAIGLSVQRPTEVFPAFSDLEKGSLLGGASHSGLDSLLAVDFDDFRSANATVSDTDTPPDGVPKLKETPTDIVDVGDFELDYESSDDNAFAPTTTNSVSLLGAAATDSGYSPVGDLAPPPAENPYAKQAYKAAGAEEAETKVFSSDQLSANIPLARMETQEMDIPNWTLLETAKIDSETVPTPKDLDVVEAAPVAEAPASPATPPEQAPVKPFNPVEGLTNTPPVSHSAPTQQYQVDSLYSEDDDQQSAVMFQLTPEAQAQIQQSLQPKPPEPAPQAAPATGGGFLGDGEESMIFNADATAQIQAALAAEAAKLGLNQPAPAAPPAPAGEEDVSLLETQQLPRVEAKDQLSESQRLLQQERNQLAEERRKLDEERARFKIEAERRQLEEERRKFDEERRKIDEERRKIAEALKAQEKAKAVEPSESQRIKLQQELEVAREANRQLVVEAAEAERKRLEAELRAIREGEQKKLEIDQAREAERKRLEEQFRLSADAERKRLETEIQAAREAARRKKAEAAGASKKEPESKQWGGPKKKVKGSDGKRRSTDEVKSIEEQTALKAAQRAKEQENKTRNEALTKFCTDYAINSALHLKILGHLKRVGGRPEGKIEVSKVVDSNQAIVGQILDDFVQAKIVKRVRAPRIRGGYGYSFSASPKTRNMIVTLLRLSEDGEKWPAF